MKVNVSVVNRKLNYNFIHTDRVMNLNHELHRARERKRDRESQKRDFKKQGPNIQINQKNMV